MHRLCGALLIASTAVMWGCWRSPNPAADDMTAPLVDATTLAGTDVVPVLGESIRPDRNYVDCVTFQMAWDQLKQRFGGPLNFEKPLSLADHLNRETFDVKNISADSYFAYCERWEPGIEQRIQALRDEKFPQSSLPVPEIPGDPSGYVAYTYLFKLLKFALPFERHKQALLFQHSQQVSRVASFGSPGDKSLSGHHASELSAQVRVHSYASPDNFVISLYPKEYGDEIVLAKLRPGRTIDETIGLVQDRIANHAVQGEDQIWNANEEPLWVPLIHLNVHRRYSELEGKPFKTPQFKGTIVWTSQDLRFRLDETGARVESQASLSAKSPDGPLEPRREPRRLLFDRPFLVLLRRLEAKSPYLAVWIGNSDLLEPFH
jgi:hypothetical protein